MYFFSNGNLLKQLDNFFRKSVSVNPCNTRSVEQLLVPKINAVKCGTGFLRSSTPLIWNNFSRSNRNQVINISISKFKAPVKNNFINSYNDLQSYLFTFAYEKKHKNR